MIIFIMRSRKLFRSLKTAIRRRGASLCEHFSFMLYHSDGGLCGLLPSAQHSTAKYTCQLRKKSHFTTLSSEINECKFIILCKMHKYHPLIHSGSVYFQNFSSSKLQGLEGALHTNSFSNCPQAAMCLLKLLYNLRMHNIYCCWQIINITMGN